MKTPTAYLIEADGFTRETPAGEGWENRVRSIVQSLGLASGTEVRIYRKFSQDAPLGAGFVDHQNVRRVTTA